MNKGDDELTFTMYDATLGLGATDVVVPPHSIQSYKLPAKSAHGPTADPDSLRSQALASAESGGKVGAGSASSLVLASQSTPTRVEDAGASLSWQMPLLAVCTFPLASRR